MTTDTPCPCDGDEGWLSPCRTHKPADWYAWATSKYPRYAAATKARDPFIDRDTWLTDPTEIPEFQPYIDALTPQARTYFAEDWEREVEYGEGPGAWESALTIRDEWPTLVAATERDALRAQLEEVGMREGYRFDDWPHELLTGDGHDIATPDQLLNEADHLAELIRRAQALEAMLRRHAALADKPTP
ncbi:hypothetical protein [Microbispora bryophytorum]|uniref:hypothetical protein n=1 Tax=Microbispora bryophytorum TaxID=1460882 RepID=UPI0033C42205